MLQAQAYGATPENLAPELCEPRKPFLNRQNWVSSEWSGPARETPGPVGNQELRLADAAAKKKNLPRRRIGDGLLRRKQFSEWPAGSERRPARLAAPSGMDKFALVG